MTRLTPGDLDVTFFETGLPWPEGGDDFAWGGAVADRVLGAPEPT
jgi:hypothetical protein